MRNTAPATFAIALVIVALATGFTFGADGKPEKVFHAGAFAQDIRAHELPNVIARSGRGDSQQPRGVAPGRNPALAHPAHQIRLHLPARRFGRRQAPSGIVHLLHAGFLPKTVKPCNSKVRKPNVPLRCLWKA